MAHQPNPEPTIDYTSQPDYRLYAVRKGRLVEINPRSNIDLPVEHPALVQTRAGDDETG